MLTPDQQTAILMEIADLRIKVANLSGENLQLKEKVASLEQPPPPAPPAAV